MANYSYSSIGITTTEVILGFSSTSPVAISTNVTLSITDTNGTVRYGDITQSSTTPVTGFFRGKRPASGIVYPRNVKYDA